MMFKTKLFCSLLLICIFSIVPSSADTELVKIPDIEFNPWLSFSQGDGINQLLWLSDDNGGILDGPFQGPMAFITDRNGNLWAGDTLNAKITAYSSRGRLIKSVDLVKVARSLKLASDPVLVDLCPGMPGKLLVGDAANNAVIEIDLRNAPARVFSAADSKKNAWLQINRLHSDGSGNIYLEDVAMRRTIVLDKNGKPFGKPLEGQIGLAIAKNGRTAILAADESGGKWRVLVSEKPNSPLRAFVSLIDDEPVIWASLQGYDALNRLHVIYDTPSSRYYLAITADGSMVRKYQTAHPEPGYDPTVTDWVDAKGRLYKVRITAANLEIMTLK